MRNIGLFQPLMIQSLGAFRFMRRIHAGLSGRTAENRDIRIFTDTRVNPQAQPTFKPVFFFVRKILCRFVINIAGRRNTCCRAVRAEMAVPTAPVIPDDFNTRFFFRVKRTIQEIQQ